MIQNESWNAIADKQPGDTITLVLTGARFFGDTSFPDRLAEGTVTDVHGTSRVFTLRGASQRGAITYLEERRAQETPGRIDIGGREVMFRVAMPYDIERLSCETT